MAGLAQNLGVMTKALNLRTQRHQILASNIANADTPGYKARDLDFSKAMQGALAGRGEGVGLVKTSARHLEGGGGFAFGHLQYRKESQSAVDGNTVDMDVERAQISENALQYQVLTRLIGDRLQSMRLAISSNQG